MPRNAVVSRSKEDWTTGLELMANHGVHVGSAESILFDLLKEGRGEAFKAISRIVR